MKSGPQFGTALILAAPLAAMVEYLAPAEAVAAMRPGGAEIPDGVLAYRSGHEPMPLTHLEKMLVPTSAAGDMGWHFAITRNATYAPYLPNYSGAAGGRTFPSAAGFHVSEVFYTDDGGVYLFETRDAHELVERGPTTRSTSTP